MSAPTHDELRACCADAYSSPAARWLLGDSYHPGGARLTGRLAAALPRGAQALVADVASGPGTSALQIARENGCAVVGIELSPGNVEAATGVAQKAGLADRVTFRQGDAEALALGDASVDGVLSECALCTFPDKAAALSEVARVLRPGGVLAMSDMTADVEALGPELRSIEAWVACLGGARPLDELAALIAASGLELEEVEAHDDAVAEMIGAIELKLRAARALGPLVPAALTGGIGRGLELVDRAREALSAGLIGYGVVIARRPG